MPSHRLSHLGLFDGKELSQCNLIWSYKTVLLIISYNCFKGVRCGIINNLFWSIALQRFQFHQWIFLLSLGKDDHDIRKQEEVLQESLMMVPDCQRRLVKAYEDLTKTLEEVSELKDTEDYSAAVKVLADAKPELPADGQAILHFCWISEIFWRTTFKF